MINAKRFTAIILCLLMILSAAVPASADVVTVGVYFSGIKDPSQGSSSAVKLEGSFRVRQNGEEAGVIRAGKDTITLTGTGEVRIEVMPESVAPGWDLSTAYVTIKPEAGGTTVVPIIVYPAGGDDTGTDQTTDLTGEGTEKNGTDEPEADLNESPEDDGTGENTGRQEEPEETIEPYYSPDTTPAAADLTAAPKAENTPVPEMKTQDNSASGGSVRVRVFNDKNTNGEQGPYETGASGVTVYLLEADGETPAAAGETDSEGEILFSGIVPGEYRLRFFAPDEWGFTELSPHPGLTFSCVGKSAGGSEDSEAFAVSVGDEVEFGAGIAKMIHVSGFCWLETEADGIRKDGEQMLPGIKITLEGQKNGLYYETTSDENGNWRIDRVRPGFYTITTWAPEGMMFTRYSKTGGKNRSIFTTEGVTKASKTLDTNDKTSKEDQNIGFMWAARVTGRAFLDANYNGLYDEGELPMAGVKITAIKQVKEEEVAVTYSADDGTFTLDGLRGNTFKLRAVLPDDGSDFTRTVSDLLGNHFKARPGRRENFWTDFVLADAETREMNVGVIYPGTLSGTVYMDNDFSGSLTGSEKTVSGFVVSLVNQDGAIEATDKTSAKGVFEFTGLAPGYYTLSMTANEGYAFTKKGEGNVALNKTGGEGYSDPILVPLGENVTGADIGMILPGKVEGMVFADLNDNGRRDENETGLEGALARLVSEEEGDAFSAEIGSSGTFMFDAVMPGRYRMEYQLPEGAIFASVTDGGNAISGENGSGAGEWFNFGTGDQVTVALCGGLTLGRIEGYAYSDPDGNGEMDAAEGKASGLTISLVPSRSDLEELTVTTGEDGAFAIEDIHPDTYTLRVTAPEGKVLSRISAGMTLPLTPGEAEQSVKLAVPMGEKWEGQALGVVIPASIKGRLWLDENNNGLMEDWESTPKGYSITVTDSLTGSVFSTLTTDDEGSFGTSGMIPGTFSLSFKTTEDIIGAPEGDSTFTGKNGSLVMEGITLTENETREGLLLGIVEYTAMSGNVWIEREQGREPLSGALMTLTDKEGNTVQTMTTGEDGVYRFEKLMPGDYIITGDMPAGCVVVEPDDDRLGDDLVSIAAETSGRSGTSDVISLEMGVNQSGLDMGCVLPGRLGDFCWLDLNGDGLQDYNEGGIPNVRIELTRDGETVAETTTDQYGIYRFEEIYPASYILKVTAPDEVKPTARRNDLKIIASVLNETEDDVSYSIEVPVESGLGNYNADLGFVCRTEGVMPDGVGEGATQDWTPVKGSDD